MSETVLLSDAMADTPAETRPSSVYWLVGVAVSMATFMEVLDTSVANVALGHIAGNLSATSDEATWVLTSYLVANAIVLPLSGWFSALMGRKRFYLLCVVLFTLSSFLCGISMNLSMLIFFRVLQGLSGGGLAPLSQSIIIDAFPMEKRGMGLALFGITTVAAPVIGPSLGGWITDNYSWHWIFLINVPVGILAVVANKFLLEDPPYLARIRKGSGFQINYAGIVFLAIGLGALQIMLDKGQREDWFESGYIVALTAIAVVFLVISVIWELNHKSPVVDYRLLKNRNFGLATLIFFLFGFLLYASTVILPQFLQLLMGYTATLSGMLMSPGGAATMLIFPIVAKLSTTINSKFLIIVGLSLSSAGLFFMSSFNLSINFAMGMWAYAVMMAGAAFVFIPLAITAFHFIPKEKNDNASGLFNLARNIGGSVGISFVMTWLARRSQFHQHRLIDHITAFNPFCNMSLNGFERMLSRISPDPVAKSAVSKAFVYSEVQQQAAMMSFLDVFWLCAVLFIVTMGIVLFLKKVRPVGGAAAIGH